MDKRLRNSSLGIVRACADDIGAALSSINGLSVLQPVFQLASVSAGLRLKPSKCIVIPVFGEFSEDAKRAVMNWLEENIHDWSRFSVRSTAKYLGIWMGPAAATQQWKTQLAKLAGRAATIVSLALPASASLPLYSSRAAPVTSYVAQFCEPPPVLERFERRLLCRILRIPFTALSFTHLTSLADMGGPCVRTATVATKAALIRAASCELSDWVGWYRVLAALALEHNPVRMVLDHRFSPVFWDSQPIACSLARAYFDASSLPLPQTFLPPHATAPPPLLPLPLTLATRPIPQSVVSASIRTERYKADWRLLVRVRLRDVFGIDQEFDINEICATLRAASPHLAMCWIKTVSNAWTTSRRMHEATQKMCFLGCMAPDDLRHYAVCPSLSILLARALCLPLPSLPPSARFLLGISHPPSLHVSPSYLAFTVYHTARARNLFVSPNEVERVIFPIVVAARRRLAALTGPHFVMDGLASPSVANGSNTRLEPHFVINDSGPEPRFIQGGDHFMTTSFTSARIV